MEFVSFEIARKLKKKGFREKCLSYYDVEDNVGLLYNTQYTDETLPCQYMDLLQCHNTGEAESKIDDSGFCVDAPTISQALKWLREEKKIAINIEFIPYTWQYKIIDMSFERRFEPRGITLFSDYEEAAITGIEYVLDNLI